MTAIKVGSLTLEYETFGNKADPAILLVMGLGAQMIAWREPFCQMLADKGFFVIRFDNRDVGMSSRMDDFPVPDMMEMVTKSQAGEHVTSDYSLSDMAADAAGLLTALGIDKAHVVGASMGGMIAQLVAVEHGGKVLSLTSIMSTTGNSDLPPGTPEAMGALMAPAINPEEDYEGAVARGIDTLRAIGSPGFDVLETDLRDLVETAFRRGFYPQGMVRQMAAILADGDRRKRLKSVSAPTLVIHGVDDPLVKVEGGRDTAAVIGHAEILEIDGMGHNLPPQLNEQITGAIADHAARAMAV
ncbi:MAG: alpha/beta hydrolase [Parvularculales bacterium]